MTARIVVTSAKGTSRRGSTASPAGVPTTSKPPKMKISRSAAVETWFREIGGNVVSRDGSM